MEEREREEIFQDFIDRLGERERELKRTQSLNRIELMREDFKKNERINLDTRWKDIL